MKRPRPTAGGIEMLWQLPEIIHSLQKELFFYPICPKRKNGSPCCLDCDYADFCPFEKIDNQTNQLKNLQYAYDRKNQEILQKNEEISSLRHQQLNPSLSGWVSPSAHTQEIEKLKSELEETKETLKKVLDENPYKQELDEIKSCKICTENFDDNERAAVKLQCPHVFCEKCVKKIQEQGWTNFDFKNIPIDN